MEEIIHISGTKQRRYSKDKINKPQTVKKKKKEEEKLDLHSNMNKLKKAYQPEKQLGKG